MNSDDDTLGPDISIRPLEDGGVEQDNARELVRARLFDRPAKRIGRYAVASRLGAGAMGVVYRAYDPSLQRDVAVKIMLPSRASSPGRMRREATALARLNHPNVIEVFEVGEHEGGVYIAMELVEGKSLQEWLQERPNLDTVVDVLCGAGRGLAAAHDAEIVHRDFKPANVLLGDDGRPRVMDFGLAEAELPASVSDVSIETDKAMATSDSTVTGGIVGSPAYISPEQWEGRPATIASDQWSFAVTLYEACHGKRPFRGASIPALCQSVMQGTIDPSPVRLPGWLDRVLLRGLAHDPADRFASVADMIAAIEADRKRVSRLPWLAVGVGAAGLAGGVWWSTPPATPTPHCEAGAAELADVWDAARRDQIAARLRDATPERVSHTATAVTASLQGLADSWLAARREACEATQVRGDETEVEMDERLRCLIRSRRKFGAVVDLLAHGDASVLDRAVTLVDSLPHANACLAADNRDARPAPPAAIAERVAQLEGDLAQAEVRLIGAGKPREAIALTEPVVQAARQLGFEPLLAESLRNLGWQQHQAGDLAHAGENLLGAFERAEAVGDDEVAYRAAQSLAFLEGHTRGHFAEGLRWARTAEARLERLESPGDVKTGVLHQTIGNILWKKGDFVEARAEFDQALALRRRAHGPEHTAVAQSLASLGMVLLNLGEFDAAEAALDDALKIYEARLGPEHADVGWALNARAAAYARRGDYQGGRAVLERAVTIFERDPSEHPARLAHVLTNLGTAVGAMGETQLALAHIERAVHLLEALDTSPGPLAATLSQLAEVHRNLGNIDEAIALLYRAGLLDDAQSVRSGSAAGRLTNIAVLHMEVGRATKALEELAKAREILASLDPPMRPMLITIHNIAGQAHQELGDAAAAQLSFERAIAAAEATVGLKHPAVAGVYYGLGLLHANAGDHASALAVLEQSLAIADTTHAPPARRSAARFAVARSLWAVETDRVRAVVLAREAQELLVTAEGDNDNDAAEIRAWLAGHTGGSPPRLDNRRPNGVADSASAAIKTHVE